MDHYVLRILLKTTLLYFVFSILKWKPILLKLSWQKVVSHEKFHQWFNWVQSLLLGIFKFLRTHTQTQAEHHLMIISRSAIERDLRCRLMMSFSCELVSMGPVSSMMLTLGSSTLWFAAWSDPPPTFWSTAGYRLLVCNHSTGLHFSTFQVHVSKALHPIIT